MIIVDWGSLWKFIPLANFCWALRVFQELSHHWGTSNWASDAQSLPLISLQSFGKHTFGKWRNNLDDSSSDRWYERKNWWGGMWLVCQRRPLWRGRTWAEIWWMSISPRKKKEPVQTQSLEKSHEVQEHQNNSVWVSGEETTMPWKKSNIFNRA